ncbi:MAG TPA: hypothetical protein VFD55_02455 [Candidatus Angelobacter sp.]|nr:hypothetical protein [Candidatus Angelobacter sp.]
MKERKSDWMVVARIDVYDNHKDLIMKEEEKPGLRKFCEYFAIANLDVKVEVGDKIEYEPYGVNFGYFIRVIT